MNGSPVPSWNPMPVSALTVASLGSGSSGNALLIRTASSTLLVDCGVSVTRMVRGLGILGLNLSEIDVLLISHEHVDHVRELSRFAASTAIIIGTEGTARAAQVPRSRWDPIRPGQPLVVASTEVIAIPVAHDACEPCGFLIRTAEGSVAVLTDLGCGSSQVIDAIAAADLVVLEANHDEELLRRGPYPRHLQRRILSDSGHLSNNACGDLLATALMKSRTLPAVRLAHLSEANNRPHLASQTVRRRLAQSGFQIDVQPLPRREVSAMWRVEEAKNGIAQLSLGLSFDDPPSEVVRSRKL